MGKTRGSAVPLLHPLCALLVFSWIPIHSVLTERRLELKCPTRVESVEKTGEFLALAACWC